MPSHSRRWTRPASTALTVLLTVALPAAATSAASAHTAPVSAAPAAGIRPEDRWTHVSQPGGAYTTIYISYGNCSSARVKVAPIAAKLDNSGTYSYVNLCRDVDPDQIWVFVLDKGMFPPVNAHNWTVTTCWPATNQS
ncbi:hypothetical protein [Dactylosporangium matsuzakiense]|uniref:Secreted protein n=1 Tax=Dactylosporangium matsuzakiense TaxID=53360 RepID=A0A9W6KT78_9ACTN|nr:hypothetical protein [Dactylosporangium matsuzakiense]UWZ47789.1 hypothetical protein Dmats_16130 [Dactylosporangium matsuzakiense]GLL07652.1 hypothetical protein GCM10017581_094060 [Dactylosporangium matsuzakiense]